MIPSNVVVFYFIKSFEHLWASAGQVQEWTLRSMKSLSVFMKLYNHQSLGVDQALKNAENADIVLHSRSRSSIAFYKQRIRREP